MPALKRQGTQAKRERNGNSPAFFFSFFSPLWKHGSIQPVVLLGIRHRMPPARLGLTSF